ncbi:MAG: response regulator [Elainellaceae cyanobacterium]
MINPNLSLFNNLNVLVVDGDDDSRELLIGLFGTYGIKTITAKSGNEALELIKQHQPNVLISEIRLPDEDGYSLMEKVKALETTHQIKLPAIALTVYASEIDRAHSISVGFCEHLAKPCNFDTLLSTVAYLTGRDNLIHSVPGESVGSISVESVESE